MATTVTLTSKEVLNKYRELEEATGTAPRMYAVAMHFMPSGYRWFENGADWRLTLFCEQLLAVAHKRGRHVRGTHTLGKQGNC